MDKDRLLKQLKNTEFTELVNLYLEAKLGSPTTIEDLLPLEDVEEIYYLEQLINRLTEKL